MYVSIIRIPLEVAVDSRDVELGEKDSSCSNNDPSPQDGEDFPVAVDSSDVEFGEKDSSYPNNDPNNAVGVDKSPVIPMAVAALTSVLASSFSPR